MPRPAQRISADANGWVGPMRMAAEMAQLSLAEGDYPAGASRVAPGGAPAARLPGHGGVDSRPGTGAGPARSASPPRRRSPTSPRGGSKRSSGHAGATHSAVSGAGRSPADGPDPGHRRTARLCSISFARCGVRSPADPGQVLEAIAARSPEAQASRLRLEAAQAYTAAGDRAAARRMLAGLADDRTDTPRRSRPMQPTTLIGVLISDGKLEDATRTAGGASSHPVGR